MAGTIAVAGITAASAFVGAVIPTVAAEFRQRREMSHAREMRDLGEVRTRLDDVMDEGEKSLAILNEANEALVAQRYGKCEAKLKESKDRLNEVHRRVRRIRLLYGDEHDVDDGDLVIPLQDYLLAMESVYAMVEDACAQSSECDDEELRSNVGQAAEAQKKVIAVASRSVGIRAYR